MYGDIWLGSYPVIATRSVRDRDLFYNSYLQAYLSRDVRDLTRVGNEASLIRFLKTCAARTGQLLNLSDLARDPDSCVNWTSSQPALVCGRGFDLLVDYLAVNSNDSSCGLGGRTIRQLCGSRPAPCAEH